MPWSRGLNGQPAPVFLIYDGNAFGAVRLAVEHVGATDKIKFTGTPAGAAFWLRTGNRLKTEADFAQWQQRFIAAGAEVNAGAERLKFTITGTDGPVALTASAPWAAPESLEPSPTRAVLELNGTDLGAKILATTGAP